MNLKERASTATFGRSCLDLIRLAGVLSLILMKLCRDQSAWTDRVSDLNRRDIYERFAMENFMRILIQKLLKSNSSDWISFSAMLIALCSLAFTYLENRNTIKFYELATKPHYGFGYSYQTSRNEISWHDFNNGLGPARLKWMKVYVGNQRVYNWVDFAKEIGLPDDFRFEFQNRQPDQVYTKTERGKTSILFKIKSEKYFPTVKGAIERVRFEGCYCSMFGDDCWLSALGSHNHKLTDCESEPVRRWQGRGEDRAEQTRGTN